MILGSCEDKIYETGHFAETAITGLSKEDYQEELANLYEDVDETYIEEFDNMGIDEIRETVNSFNDKYKLGEPFSEEDQALLLYSMNECSSESIYSDDDFLTKTAFVTLKYNIGYSKKKYGVTTKYKGYFTTYVGFSHGEYCTNVNVSIVSGKSKLKSMKWTTYHNAYGLLGSDGSSISIGISYSGSVSSKSYKNNFSLDKQVNYSAIMSAYTSTWGVLDVATSSGEYTMNTQTYSHFE